MDENIVAFDERYDWSQLDANRSTRYDAALVDLRNDLLDRFAGSSNLDLGCGTGSYSPPRGWTLGLDGSRHMLAGNRVKHGPSPLVCSDVRRPPLRGGTFDLVYSFATLYLVPDLDVVARRVADLVRVGGHAVLEVGNARSLNTVVTRRQHERAGWARPQSVSIDAIRTAAESIGTVIEWRSLQVLPLLWPAPGQRWLLPLANPAWKAVLGRRVRGRLVDEAVSSLPGLRSLAFRHFLVVRR